MKPKLILPYSPYRNILINIRRAFISFKILRNEEAIMRNRCLKDRISKLQKKIKYGKKLYRIRDTVTG